MEFPEQEIQEFNILGIGDKSQISESQIASTNIMAATSGQNFQRDIRPTLRIKVPQKSDDVVMSSSSSPILMPIHPSDEKTLPKRSASPEIPYTYCAYCGYSVDKQLKCVTKCSCYYHPRCYNKYIDMIRKTSKPFVCASCKCEWDGHSQDVWFSRK